MNRQWVAPGAEPSFGPLLMPTSLAKLGGDVLGILDWNLSNVTVA